MEMINGNKRRLRCRPGEVIRVQVTSHGTAHGIAMSLDEEKFFDDTFTVNDDRLLVILGVFSQPSGGRYDILITGDPGGFVVVDNIRQTIDGESVSEDARAYSFQL